MLPLLASRKRQPVGGIALASPWDNLSDTGETVRYELPARNSRDPYSTDHIVAQIAGVILASFIIDSFVYAVGFLSTWLILAGYRIRDRRRLAAMTRFSVFPDCLVQHAPPGDIVVPLTHTTTAKLSRTSIVVSNGNAAITIPHLPTSIDGGPAYVLLPVLSLRMPQLAQTIAAHWSPSIPAHQTKSYFWHGFLGIAVVVTVVVCMLNAVYFGNFTEVYGYTIMLGVPAIFLAIVQLMDIIPTISPVRMEIDGTRIVKQLVQTQYHREPRHSLEVIDLADCTHFSVDPDANLDIVKSGPMYIRILPYDPASPLPDYAACALLNLACHDRLKREGRVAFPGIVHCTRTRTEQTPDEHLQEFTFPA